MWLFGWLKSVMGPIGWPLLLQNRENVCRGEVYKPRKDCYGRQKIPKRLHRGNQWPLCVDPIALVKVVVNASRLAKISLETGVIVVVMSRPLIMAKGFDVRIISIIGEHPVDRVRFVVLSNHIILGSSLLLLF